MSSKQIFFHQQHPYQWQAGDHLRAASGKPHAKKQNMLQFKINLGYFHTKKDANYHGNTKLWSSEKLSYTVDNIFTANHFHPAT